MKKIALLGLMFCLASTSALAQNQYPTTSGGTLSSDGKIGVFTGQKKDAANIIRNNGTLWNTWTPRTSGAVGNIVFTGSVEIYPSPTSVFISPDIRVDNINPRANNFVFIPSIRSSLISPPVGGSSVSIPSIESQTINNTGNITTASLTVSSANIGSITGNSLSYTSGSINTLTVNNTATVNNLFATSAVVSANAAIGGDLTVGTQQGGGNAVFYGNVRANAYYHRSDENLKKNIVPLSADKLEHINHIGGYSYTWKESGTDTIGVIAQEVQKHYPELVTKGPDGYLNVESSGLVGLLIAENQRKEKRIKDLEEKTKSLETRLQDIEERLNRVEK